MSASLPPEPDPLTAVACECCGEQISPEGALFLRQHQLGPDELDSAHRRIKMPEIAKAFPRNIRNSP